MRFLYLNSWKYTKIEKNSVESSIIQLLLLSFDTIILMHVLVNNVHVAVSLQRQQYVTN